MFLLYLLEHLIFIFNFFKEHTKVSAPWYYELISDSLVIWLFLETLDLLCASGPLLFENSVLSIWIWIPWFHVSLVCVWIWLNLDLDSLTISLWRVCIGYYWIWTFRLDYWLLCLAWPSCTWLDWTSGLPLYYSAVKLLLCLDKGSVITVHNHT